MSYNTIQENFFGIYTMTLNLVYCIQKCSFHLDWLNFPRIIQVIRMWLFK